MPGMKQKIVLTEEQRQAFVELGRTGGKARAAKLSPEKRKKIAKKASKAAAKKRKEKAAAKKKGGKP